MKRELDEKLCKDFPLTFRDRHGDMRATCMVWGFPGSGWEPLIRRAAEKIEPIIQKFVEEGGEKDGVHRLTSMQVKEKFGTLRWYFTLSHPEIDTIIREATKASSETCEDCGEEGKTRGSGYVLTQCDDCYETRIENKARDHLFYEVLGELRKRGDLDAITHLKEWKERQEAKKKEKDNEQDDKKVEGS